MNKFIGCGRLTNNVDLKYSSKDTSMAIARYTLAIDRMKKKDQDKADVDFIRCVAFGKAGEFASKYFHKGKRVLVEGRLQTGSYKNKNGTTIPTADIIVDHQEFADGNDNSNKQIEEQTKVDDGFIDFEIAGTTEDDIPF